MGGAAALPMKPALFFSYGVTKSATTLAYHLTAGALEEAGHPPPALPTDILGAKRRINAVAHLDDSMVAQLLDIANKHGTPIVLKTHTRPDPGVVRLIETGQAKAHAICRDPRDIALSMLDHGQAARARGKPAFSEFHTLDDTIAGLQNQFDTLSAWLQLPGVRPLFYNDLAFRTEEAAADIADHLGVAVQADALAARVLRDKFIQFNKGMRDRHRQEMSPADSARFEKIFAPFYRLLLEALPANLLKSPVLSPRTQLWSMDNAADFDDI